ncbi:hypothetical protein RJI07_08690 [Mycoplasmatota bacterium WC30]
MKKDFRFLISEPWDFVSELEKGSNIIKVKIIEKSYFHNGTLFDVYKVDIPFVYKGSRVEHLLLAKRHKEFDNCFNAFIGVWSEKERCIEGKLINSFIGNLEKK